MSEMQSIVSNIQDLVLENDSVSFVRFYHEVFNNLNTSNVISSNQQTLSNLRHTYARKLRRNDPCIVSFDSLNVRCAYIFQFCPVFSLSIASHFLNLMKSVSQQQLQRLALADNLAICCLGGGPGTGIVAICKVLQEVRRRFASTIRNPLMVDATVVDAESGWSTTAEIVVNTLPSLVDESVVQIERFRFIVHDFTETMSQDVATVLGQSDVVTMNKFLSALHGTSFLLDRTGIMQDTWEHMPEGSILFLMDSSHHSLWTIDAMVPTVGMEPIYGIIQIKSIMSSDSIILCQSLYSGVYGGQCCTAQSSNKAVAWLKTSSSDSS